MARLLDDAYIGTIDEDPDADHSEELATWRQVDGADDEASSLAVDDDVVGACLIGRELGAAFLYEIAVAPFARRRDLARALLARSLSVLAARVEPHIAAWVTSGNTASETLLYSAGFVPVTPAVEPTVALGYYRAAGAVRLVGPDPTSPLAATVGPGGPVLWIFDGDDPAHAVVTRDVTVTVRHLDPSAPEVVDLAGRAMPLRHAAWLLGQRVDRSDSASSPDGSGRTAAVSREAPA